VRPFLFAFLLLFCLRSIAGGVAATETEFFLSLETNKTKAFRILEQLRYSKSGQNKQRAFYHLLNAHFFLVQSRLDSAGVEFHNALSIYEKINDISGQIKARHGAGVVSIEQSDSGGAFSYFRKGYELATKNHLDSLSGVLAISLSGVYFDARLIAQSALWNETARKHFSAANVLSGSARCDHQQAILFLDQQKYEQAKELLISAEKALQQLGMMRSRLPVINSLGVCYWNLEQKDKALGWFRNGLELAVVTGERNVQRSILENLAYLLNETGQYRDAFDYLNQSYILKDSLFMREANKLLQDMASKYQAKQKQAEIIQLKKERHRTQKVLLAVVVILVFFTVFIIIIYRLNIRMKVANRVLRIQKKEIEKQKEELNASKQLADSKNREITESIQYAYGLQQAILPDEKQLRRAFPQHFIFYLPKDIVAGDFFWFRESTSVFWFAVADCTGHGVPGAMVSVIAHNALNNVSDDETLVSPAELLMRTRKLIENAFAATGRKDGMDISVAAFFKNQKKVLWAGANLPLWVCRGAGIMEIKPDKQPVGYFEKAGSFTDHVIEVQKDDRLVFFTDGYSDQFGGASGKKMTRKKFREIALEGSQLSLHLHQQHIVDFFYAHTSSFEQVDDVLVAIIQL
jgi:serine phosphatase RsbU (regulator of sigma subunit)